LCEKADSEQGGNRPMTTTQAPNPKRVAAGKLNRLKYKGLAAEGRGGVGEGGPQTPAPGFSPRPPPPDGNRPAAAPRREPPTGGNGRAAVARRTGRVEGAGEGDDRHAATGGRPAGAVITRPSTTTSDTVSRGGAAASGVTPIPLMRSHPA